MVSSIPPKPNKNARRIPPLPPLKSKGGKSAKRSKSFVSKIAASNKDLKQKQKQQQFLKKRITKSESQFSKLMTVVKKSIAKLIGKKRPLSKEEKRNLLKYKV